MIKHLPCVFATTALFILPSIVRAQTYAPSDRNPVADNTLGTQVSASGNNFNITGGLNRGQTLFHSFSDFSIQKDRAANFINSPATRDIITRVTGNNFSDINGLINSNGANFFLINPNGVTFGTDAKLNVGRAFMASTANGINLVDAGGRAITFGTNPNGDAPLLSVAPNVLFNVASLTMAGSNGQINNFGTLKTNNPGQYIGLIGGNVSFNGGQIDAPGGRVEIGGLSAPGNALLGGEGDNLRVQFPADVARGDVAFNDRSRVNVAAAGGGNIAINARNLEILGESVLRGGIEIGLGTPEAIAGDIQLKATGNMLVGGSGSGINNLVRLNSTGRAGNITVEAGSFNLRNGNPLNSSNYGRGNAGNISIKADSVTLQDGGAIISSTFGVGNAGNVTVTAKDAVLIKGNASIFSNVDVGGVGKGGNIDIMASSLYLQDGSVLASLTNNGRDNQPAGKGDAGNINITVTGAVDVSGTQNGFVSVVVSSIAPGATGKGGDITIDSGSLSLRDGALLQSSTYGVGNAGNVTVKAKDNVSLVGNSNTGILSTVEAGGVGKGGNIDITAGSLSLQDAQLLTLTRSATDTQPAGKGDAGNVTIKITGAVDIANTNPYFASGIASIVDTDSVGNAGNITISAASVNLQNGSQLQSATFGFGNAGTIKINATEFVTFSGKTDKLTSSLFVNSESPTGTAGDIVVTTPKLTLDSGTLNAKSVSGNGGNIKIQQADLLLLRRGGQITTNAGGTAESGGNGGNINIDSKLIVAIPTENSDISANAVKGRGGNVNINSQGLFGIQFRPQPTENSDITASSDFGQSGSVNIDTPGTDPGRDSTELPNAPTDASNRISQACSSETRQNKLTATGRGGLPPNAYDPLNSDVVWQDARAAKSQPAASNATTNPLNLPPPAVGWKFDGKGKVMLIAAGAEGQPTGTKIVCPTAAR